MYVPVMTLISREKPFLAGFSSIWSILISLLTILFFIREKYWMKFPSLEPESLHSSIGVFKPKQGIVTLFEGDSRCN